MDNTKLRELLVKIAALAPLCNFQIAEALSHRECLFYRKWYERFNLEVCRIIAKQEADLEVSGG